MVLCIFSPSNSVFVLIFLYFIVIFGMKNTVLFFEHTHTSHTKPSIRSCFLFCHTIIQKFPIFNFIFKTQLNVLLHRETNRYQILATQAIAGVNDVQKVAKLILESTSLDPDQYRLGNSKACPINLLPIVSIVFCSQHSQSPVPP